MTLVTIEAAPLINEIMFLPQERPTENPAEEWLELHLLATDEAADLSGWKFTHGVAYIFPDGTILQPGSFLVVAANANTFNLTYIDLVGTVLCGWQGKVSNVNERILLKGQHGK